MLETDPKQKRIKDYGYFDATSRSFILTENPPTKWWNVHYNQPADDEIYADCSHLGDGPVRLRDRKGVELRLTGYDSRCIYLRDEASGTAFSPWGCPLPQAVGNRSCTYHAAYTEIASTCADFCVRQRVFVPRDQPVEVTSIFLRNRSEKTRVVSVFSYLLFDLSGRDAEGKPFFKDNYTEILPDLGAVLAVNRNQLCPHDRCKAYSRALAYFHAADGYRDHVQRQDFSIAAPRLLWGEDCQNRVGYGPDCAAMLQCRLEIPPDIEGRVDFVLGQCRDAADIKAQTQDLTAETIDNRFAERVAFENKRAGAFRIRTGRSNLDALFNDFIKKQISSYNINKSGIRDNLQNDVSLAMIDYPTARENLLRVLASQYPNGECPHGFRPLVRLRYADKPAWLFLAIPELIKESGDFSLLETEVPFLDSSETGSVLEHMIRAMRYLATDTGRHGLCRQHHADWNDGLEATEAAGERESVMVTQQLCYGMREFATLAHRINRIDLAREAEQIFETFDERLNTVAWDGEWYVRTLCEDGYRIGSHENKEGRIFMNTQSWAILSGTARGERAARCMASVDRWIETDVGYRICHPGFSKYDPRIGRMSNSMPGHVENGGCYNHAAGFKTVADCLLGRADAAWRTLLKVAPDSDENPVGRSGAAPFAFNNFYSQVPQIYGQSGYPWRTGTASWFNFALLEFIFGIRRDYDGLRIQPCLPAEISEATVSRHFRGQDLQVHFRHDPKVDAMAIRQDGEPVVDNCLKLSENPGLHVIDVILPHNITKTP